MQRVKNDTNARVDVPDAALRIATTYSLLARAGVVSFSDANTAFQAAAQAMNTINGGQSTAWYYHYAYFLLSQKRSAAQIDAQLSHIYAGGLTTSDGVVACLEAVRTGDVTKKRAVVALAKADPKFAAYLKTLHWTDADLKG
jgi:hypothetical protein